jgi:hypothetical protein
MTVYLFFDKKEKAFLRMDSTWDSVATVKYGLKNDDTLMSHSDMRDAIRFIEAVKRNERSKECVEEVQIISIPREYMDFLEECASSFS